MVIDDLKDSSSYKLFRILNILESTHGITIDFDTIESIDELSNVYEACKAERNRMIAESAFNSDITSSEYTRVTLIQEAVRIFLREIAPKRIKRNKTSS